MGNEAMVMGDLVLTGDEVNPVMKKLLESGIEITALHNHLLRSEPATMYMHVAGQGDPVKLATALHRGLALSKTPLGHARRRAAARRRRDRASTPARSTPCSVSRARRTAASISSRSRAPSR